MNFNQLAKDIIGSFLKLFGFNLKSEIKGLIEYEHKVLIISLSYDYSRSYEVEVNFSFKSNGESFTFDELKEYFGYERKGKHGATQITKLSELTLWIKIVKDFLDQNLIKLIDDHIKVGFELDKLRIQRINEYTNEKQKRFLKEDVDKFWKNKNYHGLVEILSEIEIDGSMRKKYEYALKMINKD